MCGNDNFCVEKNTLEVVVPAKLPLWYDLLGFQSGGLKARLLCWVSGEKLQLPREYPSVRINQTGNALLLMLKYRKFFSLGF